MNYNETLEYIHSLGQFSMPAGLTRIKEVLTKLSNPQNNFKSIHIAGTNGKGSVSAMLSSVFKTAGYKTGLFISPFIIDFRERIQISGEYISQEDLCDYAERIKATNVALTEFEFITALAFLYFKEKNIDILICETGLGGRFDATNTLDNLACAVITKIGLDHTAILGDTFGEIAAEKCGILRNCPTVTSPNQERSALGVIKKAATDLIIPDLDELKIVSSDISGNTFIYKGSEYTISLCGEYQVENAITVIETLGVCGYEIPYNIMCRGLKETFFPARMEVICNQPLIILDGAHNPDGAKVLSKELEKYSGEVTAIIGMMKDKDYEEFLNNTLCFCKNAVAVTVTDMPRSLSAEELYNIASKICDCVTAENLANAIDVAIEKSGGKPIFIFGSLYLASAIRPILKEKF